MAKETKSENQGLLGAPLEKMLDALPPESRAQVETRSAELHAKVEGIKALGALVSSNPL